MLFQMRYVMTEDQPCRLAVERNPATRMHARLITRDSRCAHIGGGGRTRRRGVYQTLSMFSLLDPVEVLLSGLFLENTPREHAGDREGAETTDTPENRYVKYFLEECALFVAMASRNSGSPRQNCHDTRGRRLGPASARKCSRMTPGEGVGILPAWFPSNSQVLLAMRRGCRDLLRFDLALRLSLTLPWSQGEKLAEEEAYRGYAPRQRALRILVLLPATPAHLGGTLSGRTSRQWLFFVLYGMRDCRFDSQRQAQSRPPSSIVRTAREDRQGDTLLQQTL